MKQGLKRKDLPVIIAAVVTTTATATTKIGTNICLD
jgi:hypothetical protein